MDHVKTVFPPGLFTATDHLDFRKISETVNFFFAYKHEYVKIRRENVYLTA